MGWSKWWSVSSVIRGELPTGPGVYQLRAIAAGRPRRLRRISGTDRQGVLYVGKTADLKVRVWCLVRTVLGHLAAANPAGLRYLRLLKTRIDRRGLEVRWMAKATETAAATTERSVLLRYGKRFGELPPLNRSGAPDV